MKDSSFPSKYPIRTNHHRNTHARLNGIHEMLKSRSYPSKKRLADRFGYSVRTIERDLEQMRDDFDAPIEYCSSRRGYYYTSDFSGLVFSGLSEREEIALMLAREMLQSEHLDGLGESISELIQKANSKYPDKFSILSRKIEEHITCVQPDSDSISEDQIIILIHSIFDKNVISFNYKKPGEGYEIRKVHPYHLTNAEGDWYLKGHCEKRNELRTFKIQRIRKIRVDKDSFLTDPGYDVEDCIKGSMGGFSGNENYVIRVELDDYVTAHLKEKKIHDTQRLLLQTDDSAILELELNNLMDIKRWVLSWGEHVTVIDPPEFVKSMRDTLSECRKKYK